MLESILFKDKRFDTSDNNNLMADLTNNTIILCSDYKVMTILADEILKTVNGYAEYNDYFCDDEDIGKANYTLYFGLQRVIEINDQKIILCLEPAMIYRAKNIEDIWFATSAGEGDTYKEAVYSLDAFIGSKDIYAEGLDKVYKFIVSGRFGCYDGNWVNLTEAKV